MDDGEREYLRISKKVTMKKLRYKYKVGSYVELRSLSNCKGVCKILAYELGRGMNKYYRVKFPNNSTRLVPEQFVLRAWFGVDFDF